MKNTVKLYQDNVYIREWDAVITSVRPLNSDKTCGNSTDGSYSAGTAVTEDNVSHITCSKSPGNAEVNGKDSVKGISGGAVRITLDKTAFFPEGGGQSCDTGTLTLTEGDTEFVYYVTDVQENDDSVLHTLELHCPAGSKPANKASSADRSAASSQTPLQKKRKNKNSRNSLASNKIPEMNLSEDKFRAGNYSESAFSALIPGAAVHCRLNWNRRFDNMQRHCGEHILSGVFYRECGGVNRGFHMGEDYMTLDLSLEENPANPDTVRPAEITPEIAARCEMLANEIIWADLPVTVLKFDDPAEASMLPLRKKLTIEKDISIVRIGSPEDPADCVACCGTHPSSSGQVGLIKIYKVEKYKNMFRIYLEAGKRALLDFRMKHDMLSRLTNSYSCSVEDFPAKLRANENKLKAAKDELFNLKNALIKKETSNLDRLLEEDNRENNTASHSVLVYPLEDLGLNDTFTLAKSYMGKSRCMGRLLMLYSVHETSFILVSDGSCSCGALVKAYANFYNGKGGGNDVSARAIFTNNEDARLFADLITKHLS